MNTQNGHLQFDAAAETNAVTLSANSNFVLVSDANALITPGPGCFKGAPAHAVACSPLSLSPPNDFVQVELGDRVDSLTVPPSLPLRVVAHGRDGDDVLAGASTRTSSSAAPATTPSMAAPTP